MSLTSPSKTQKQKREQKQRREQCWLLSVHYAEQSRRSGRTINDPCSCERKEWEHVCETVRFSLRRVDCDECCNTVRLRAEVRLRHGSLLRAASEEQPPQALAEAEQAEQYEPDAAATRRRTNPVRRGGCQCLCDHLTGL